jgi:hypothetical protein
VTIDQPTTEHPRAVASLTTLTADGRGTSLDISGFASQAIIRELAARIGPKDHEVARAWRQMIEEATTALRDLAAEHEERRQGEAT